MTKIRVLVVDDSAFMRKMVSDLLSEDPQIEVIYKARNGMEGVNKVKELAPDVVTMDIEMPVLNGLDALQVLMKEHPVPVVMLSSLTQEGAMETLKALEIGAVDFVPKPSGSISLDIHKVQTQLIQKVKSASKSRINHTTINSTPIHNNTMNSLTAHSITNQQAPTQKNEPFSIHTKKATQLSNLILVGTSTGGPKALQILLSSIPANLPAAILVVQHMPAGFTKSLSQRLDTICPLQVFEAEDSQPLQTGSVYIAPGDFHMELKKNSEGQLAISLNKNEPKGGHRPSVDTLFESAARIDHLTKYAVIMTGMGSDGTKGLAALKSTGCMESIAEDESTCVVFGMPRAAIKSGNIDRVLPLNQIGPYLTKALADNR